MTAFGTNATSENVCFSAAYEGEADISAAIGGVAVFQLSHVPVLIWLGTGDKN
jgi:hypothetical protein